MFAVSLYMIFMSKHYDQLIAGKLPAGADIKTYNEAPPGSEFANVLAEAKKAAGPEVINFTLIIPIILIFAFAGLTIYMRGRKKPEILRAAGA